LSSALDVQQSTGDDIRNAFHAMLDAYARNSRLAKRLGCFQSRCRRRSRLVLALESSHRDARFYHLLARVVIKNLRDSKLHGVPELTAITVHMLADITYHVRQAAAKLAEQQNRLSRLRWLASVLKVKLFLCKQRIRKTERLYERLCG
jgi:transposase InsO family protein